MKSTKIICIFLTVVAMVSCAKKDYSDQEGWGGSCQTGSEQSPIDIMVNTVGKCVQKDIFEIDIDRDSTFTLQAYSSTNYDMTNPFELSTITFLKDDEVKTYKSLQYHLHRPSEHTINGQHFDAELHIVHINQNSELAVFGLLLEEGNTTSDLLPFFYSENRSEQTVKFPLQFNDSTVFHYQGSLTTPGCDEGVMWFVNSKPIIISKETKDFLDEFINEGQPNNRNITDLNGRNITNVGSNCFDDCSEGQVRNPITNDCVTCMSANLQDCEDACDNYFWKEGSCKICSEIYSSKCKECDNIGCLECMKGFKLADWNDTLVCASQPCNIGYCLDCEDNDTCKLCEDNYVLDAEKKNCVQSPCSIDDCIQCMDNDTCKMCKDGYKLDDDAKNCLKECPENVTDCQKCDSQGMCIECKENYLLNNNTKSCKKIETAQDCSETEKFNNKTSQCISCSTTDQETCDEICTDYIWMEGMCKKCSIAYDQKCNMCDEMKCKDCMDGFQLAEYNETHTACAAQPCNISYCLDCADNDTCELCGNGFEVNSTDQKSCSDALCDIEDCILCTDSSTCGGCREGYTVADDQQSCFIECPDFCSKCSSEDVCTQCFNNYLLNTTDDGETECNLDCSNIQVANCISCSSFTVCDECADGYSLNDEGTKCLQACNDENCFKCQGSADVCQICEQGYTQDTTNSSSVCAIGICSIFACQTCGSTTQCATCNTGYTWNVTDQECIPSCLGTVPDCGTCTDDTTCELCDPGFELANNTCSKLCNISFCDQCLSKTTCQECEAEYTLSSDNTVCNEQCFIDGCTTCKNKEQCAVCQSGFTISADETKCVADCRSGYYYNTDDDTCNKIENIYTGCWWGWWFRGGFRCLSCTSRSYLSSSGLCVKCDSSLTGCARCTSQTACYRCRRGYYLSASSQCVLIPTCQVKKCRYCESGSSTTCAKCRNGYVLNSSGACDPPVCAGQLQLVNGACGCNIGAYKSGKKCKQCKSGCLACTSSRCQTCTQGYFPFGRYCWKCSEGCVACTSATNCQTCEEEYTLNGKSCSYLGGGVSGLVVGGETLECPSGCSSCAVDKKDVVYCRTPRRGCVVIDGLIERCHKSCLTCSQQTDSNGEYSICLTCFDGDALDGQECVSCTDPFAQTCEGDEPDNSLTCKKGYTAVEGICEKCDEACEKCDVNGKGFCDSGFCNDGYSLQTEDNTCAQCLNGCSECTQNDVSSCINCGNYKYKDAAGECLSCISNCKICSDATTCTTCNKGYQIESVGSTCKLVPDYPCSSYDASTIVCTKCFKGFTLDTNTNTCSVSVSCNSTGTCTQCPRTYYIDAGICLPCPTIDNCYSCNPTVSKKDRCLTCNTRYFFDGTSCLACSAGCRACLSTTQCTKADSGFFLLLNPDGTESGTTGACESPCSTCKNDNSSCFSCVSGYTLKGSICKSDRRHDVTCTFNGGTSWGLSNFRFRYRRFWWIFCWIFNFRNGRGCGRRFFGRGMRSGSIIFDSSLDQNSVSTLDSSAISNADSNFTSVGASVGSISVTSTSSSSEEDSANLGLILGVSIPLVILLIVIIALVIKLKKNDETMSPIGYNSQKDYKVDHGIEDV